jgi:thymidylate synthase (FAD)
MITVWASWSIEYSPPDAAERLERIARTCYKSEDRICPGSAEKLLRSIRARGHLSVFDHVSASVRFIVDRGVSHELVRHRIAAYSMESSRFCNYGKTGEVTFIKPCFLFDVPVTVAIADRRDRWLAHMQACENAYLTDLCNGRPPEEARCLLPNSLKTEIVATLDFTAWRHVFTQRTSPKAHPQMREVMVPLLAEFTARWPWAFDDIKVEGPK